MRVVTYCSSHNSRITLDVEQIRVLKAHGKWPKDYAGEDFCHVYFGEHEGVPDYSDGELYARVELDPCQPTK